MGRYAEAFRRSLADPDGFWGEAARAIDWYRPPRVVLDSSSPPFYRWFTGGVLNTCFNAVDRHVRDGRGEQAALIYDSPVTGIVRTFTYRELADQVAWFAGVLRGLGVGAGDRVVIYLPMIPEAVIAMLACAVHDRRPCRARRAASRPHQVSSWMPTTLSSCSAAWLGVPGAAV